MINKTIVKKWTYCYYYLNFALYLFQRFEPFIYSFFITCLIRKVYFSGIDIGFTIKVSFLICFALLTYFVKYVASEFLTIFVQSICIKYLEANPLIVIINTNENYNETIRQMFYFTNKDIVLKMRRVDACFGENILRLLEPFLTLFYNVTNNSLYGIIYQTIYFEHVFYYFLSGPFKKQKKSLLRRIFMDSVSNFKKSNSNCTPTSFV